ncbi:MAG: LuxR C-terminal-related transcriptional regulator [Pirellulaceae bacterium]
MIGQILGSRVGEGLLARIFTELTRREREVLWAFLVQPDDHKLAFLLQIQPQTVRNHLAEIESKLLIDGRPALASQVLLALWRESRNLANS